MVARTLEAMLTDLAGRLGRLERRKTPVPGRLSPTGMVVTDWNDATLPGFYSASPGTPNGPDVTSAFAGVVYVGNTGRIVQNLSDPTSTVANLEKTFRRVWTGSSWTAWYQLEGDTAWINLTLASGWTGSALQYRVKDNAVEFKGEFWGGADMSTVFTMPVGARPISRLSFPVFRVVGTSANLWGTINIQSTGIATFVAATGLVSSSPGYSVGALRYPVAP